jgi:hypothetical protein
MKIGILTFHRATNYGAVLQAYSLREYLKGQGYDVSVIDYTPNGMGRLFMEVKGYPLVIGIKRMVRNILNLPSLPLKLTRRRLFSRFVKDHLNITNRVLEGDSVVGFDYIFIGSDQVWNIDFTNHRHDSFYWGKSNFGTARLVSYAASASENLELSITEDCIPLLNKFFRISVREEELANRLFELGLNKKITKVLDPTLIVDKNVFQSFLRNLNLRYVLLYQVKKPKDNHAYEIAKQIAETKGIKVIEICSYVSSNKVILDHPLKKRVNPAEFVNFFITQNMWLLLLSTELPSL